jgi:hypothetical protein
VVEHPALIVSRPRSNRSPFTVHRSPFPVPGSPFDVYRSQHSKQSRGFYDLGRTNGPGRVKRAPA